MLVLSRKKNEEIVATLPDGSRIKVMIVDVRGEKIRLGFTAPPNVKIYRQEVFDRIALSQEDHNNGDEKKEAGRAA